jgi:hypothetical protein
LGSVFFPGGSHWLFETQFICLGNIFFLAVNSREIKLMFPLCKYRVTTQRSNYFEVFNLGYKYINGVSGQWRRHTQLSNNALLIVVKYAIK